MNTDNNKIEIEKRSSRIKNTIKSLIFWSILFSFLVHFGSVFTLTKFFDANRIEEYSANKMSDRFVRMIEEQKEEEIELPEPEKEEEREEIQQEYVQPTEEILEEKPEEEVVEEIEEEPEDPSIQEVQVTSENSTREQSLNSENINGGGLDGGVGNGDGPASGSGSGSSGGRQSTGERRAERREDNSRTEENRNRITRLEDASKPPCEQSRREPSVPYPQELRERAIHGTIQIQCIVTETGHLRGCRYRGGPEELFRIALPIVEQWRCSPAENSEGERIAAPFSFRIPFRLED